MARVKILLEEGLAVYAETGSLWWPLPTAAQEVKELLRNVLDAVGLQDLPIEEIKVLLGGFDVLLKSSTALLRDGDLLEISRRRQQKKRKRDDEGVATVAAPETKPARKNGLAPEPAVKKTPPAANEVPPATEKPPSRSARRKAAKRRRKRLGLPVLPIQSNGKDAAVAKQQAPVKPNNTRLVSHRVKVTSNEPSSTSATSTSNSDSDSSSSSSSSSESKSSSSDNSSSKTASGSLSSSFELNATSDLKKGLTEKQFEELSKFDVGGTLMDSLNVVVAYKLLELGEDYAPQISEIRLGKIIEIVEDQGEIALTLEPYPDPSVHPLKATNLGNLQEQQQEEEFVEEQDGEGLGQPVPTNYDEETGILHAGVSMFADIRYCSLEEKNIALDGPNEGQQTPIQRKPIAATYEPLGPTNYSRLGPPKPTHSPLSAVAVTADAEAYGNASNNSLASLLRQLQRRRAELSTPEPKSAQRESDPGASGIAQQPQNCHQQQQKSNGVKKQRGPRRGVLQSALGPVLKMLRNSDTLNG